jgi:Ca-activated chloride channel family protein
MNYKITGSFVIALLLCLSCISRAQQQTQTVLLHVRVTDPADKAVLDVPQSSFQVTEDGVPQKITLFINKEIPLSYGLVIDTSGSMRSQIGQVVNAAARVVLSNRPADETFLVRFISSDKVYVEVEPTSNKEALLRALADFFVEGGSSAVIDAVYMSAEKLAQQKDTGELRRRALILVTDGEDRVSFYKQEKLFQLLSSNNIQIFTIGLTKDLPDRSRPKAIEFLKKLGVDTGGRTYFPASTSDIERVAGEIINDIRTQYVIGYEPSGGDPAKDFHKVEVSITENPNQEKRVAITRVGYQSRKK